MNELAGPKNLTGVWNGLYSYSSGLSVSFVATLIDSGSALSGATHEPNVLGTSPGSTLTALLSGGRNDSAITFVKTYDEAGTGPLLPGQLRGRAQRRRHRDRRPLAHRRRHDGEVHDDPLRGQGRRGRKEEAGEGLGTALSRRDARSAAERRAIRDRAQRLVDSSQSEDVGSRFASPTRYEDALRYFFVALHLPPGPPFTSPLMALPLTRPV